MGPRGFPHPLWMIGSDLLDCPQQGSYGPDIRAPSRHRIPTAPPARVSCSRHIATLSLGVVGPLSPVSRSKLHLAHLRAMRAYHSQYPKSGESCHDVGRATLGGMTNQEMADTLEDPPDGSSSRSRGTETEVLACLTELATLVLWCLTSLADAIVDLGGNTSAIADELTRVEELAQLMGYRAPAGPPPRGRSTSEVDGWRPSSGWPPDCCGSQSDPK